MIIKLAMVPSDEYEQTLNTREKGKWKAMKRGAILGGGVLAAKNATTLQNELKPSAGRVKRFLHESGIRKASLKDMVSKRHLTAGKGLKMGAIGVLGGALTGLAVHEGMRKLYQAKQNRQR